MEDFKMIVKIKKLHPEAVIPKYAKPGDAGLDLVAIGRSYNLTMNYIEYSTGLAFEIPKGHVGLIFPRSSICKKELRLTNAVGVIDSQYRGEIKFFFKSEKDTTICEQYEVGDRIGQLIIMPYPQIYLKEVEELSSTERGTGGFGSTGA